MPWYSIRYPVVALKHNMNKKFIAEFEKLYENLSNPKDIALYSSILDTQSLKTLYAHLSQLNVKLFKEFFKINNVKPCPKPKLNKLIYRCGDLNFLNSIK